MNKKHAGRGANAAAALLAVSGLAAQAQDMPGGEADMPQRPPGARLERVEVAGRPQSDTDLRRQSSTAKQIFGREELDRYGDTNLSDVLRRLPGVNIQDGAPRMRGLGAGYTLILINGDPAPPGFQFDQLDPAQVQRIELSKAPTADQSAQAMAGTINIILKEPPRSSQRDLRLGLNYGAVRPVPNGTFTLGERIGAFSASVPLSAFEWRGLNDTLLERATTGAGGLPAQSLQAGRQDVWGHGFNSAPRLNWRISDNETASLQAFLQKGHWHNLQAYRTLSSSGPAALDPNSRFTGGWQLMRGNGQWNRTFEGGSRLELKFGGQSSKGSFDGETSLGRRAFGTNEDSNLTQGGRYAQAIGESHTLSAGWNLEWRRREEGRTVTQNGVPQLQQFEGTPFVARITRQALFLQDEWEVNNRLSTYFGVRSESIRTESGVIGGAFDNASRITTPLAHLTYKLDPKGRDLIRASVSRTFKPPEPNALLARPFINPVNFDLTQSNTAATPDRTGNPALKPELATGLDLALERYLAGGGLLSVGGFYRDVSNLIRTVTSLQTVPWAMAPRFVAMPVNFAEAKTMGLEFEAKGRAGELLPFLFSPKLPLNLRLSLNVYQSRVSGVPGPDNRLDAQQPWSGNFGGDYRFTGLPLTMGASVAYTPGYFTRQSDFQSSMVTRARAIDSYALWNLSPKASLRLAVNNIDPLEVRNDLLFVTGDRVSTTRFGRTTFGATLELKL